MPLATKNGSIIVKDGKLAENCGCCCEVPQAAPDAVRVKLSSAATSQYSWFIYKDQSGENAICQTMLADWSGLNNTYTLSAQNNFSITTPSVVIRYVGPLVINNLQKDVFFIDIVAGYIKVVQEYGASSAVRTQQDMLSDAWNAGTSTQSFFFDLYYNPFYWRASPQARSQFVLPRQPYISLKRQCKSSSYFLGALNNQMGVAFNGDQCSFMIGDSVTEACFRQQAYLPLPLAGEFRRLTFGTDLLSGMQGPPQKLVDESVDGFTTNAVFRAQFTVDSVELVYGDSVANGFPVNPLP